MLPDDSEAGRTAVGSDVSRAIPMGGADPAGSGPDLDPAIQSALGRALQAHFDDLVTAPIPDRFMVLLAELEAREMRDAIQANGSDAGGPAAAKLVAGQWNKERKDGR